MIQLSKNEITIRIKTDEPSQKLADIREGLAYVLKDYFSHLGNEVDIDSGSAYSEVLELLIASFQDSEDFQNATP